MSKEICYWEEFPNGYWEAGCQKNDGKKLVSFAEKAGPVVACYGVCPFCLKDIFEDSKTESIDNLEIDLN